MPELPGISIYVEALEKRVRGTRLQGSQIAHPFLLRTFDAPMSALRGRRVEVIRRIGKRIALGFDGDHWLVLHLMIAGRLHWFPGGTKVQRIRDAEHETNYCARCQTGGKLLADRALSRLLKSDWPKTVDELERI